MQTFFLQYIKTFLLPKQIIGTFLPSRHQASFYLAVLLHIQCSSHLVKGTVDKYGLLFCSSSIIASTRDLDTD